MKALSLATLLFLSNIGLSQAAELRPYEAHADMPITNPFLKTRDIASVTPTMETTVQTHVRIAQLERELEIQRINYEKKIEYLQTELKKSQKTLVDRSLNQIKKEKMINHNHFLEKKDMTNKLAITNQKIQEYQQLLLVVKPNQDTKLLIESNTKLAAELRKASDQLAHPNFKNTKEAVATKEAQRFGGRLPASE